jgi:hypothetical protein
VVNGFPAHFCDLAPPGLILLVARHHYVFHGDPFTLEDVRLDLSDPPSEYRKWGKALFDRNAVAPIAEVTVSHMDRNKLMGYRSISPK